MQAIPETERHRLVLTADAEARLPSADEAINIIQESIFGYLNSKVPSVPGNLFSLDSYDHDSGLLSTEDVKTKSLKIWSGRLMEPDTTVPGRSWQLELSVGESAGKVIFASRLSCFSRHLDFYFEPAVPRIYKDLVSKGILFGDGIKLSRSHTDIVSDDDVSWLIELINSPKRRRMVIALSCDDSGICPLNPIIFSNRLCGIAHVVKIFPHASFQLSDSIGKHLSVFDRGIRLYRPTGQIEADDPLSHPLYTRFQLNRLDPDRTKHLIALEAFRLSVEGAVTNQAVPTFAQVRSANATFRLAQMQVSTGRQDMNILEGRLRASQEARLAAEAQAREALDLALQEENSRKLAEDDLSQERARAMMLTARVRLLEGRIKDAPKADERPGNYDQVADWIAREYAGRMKLHARALRGLRSGNYQDIGLVCEMLDALAGNYVDSKRGDRAAWKKFETLLAERGVEISRSISESRAGEEGEEYFVRYNGERKFIESHLKKGVSRDSRRDMRIYFFWDELNEEVVVAHLPSHLDTRLT